MSTSLLTAGDFGSSDVGSVELLSSCTCDSCTRGLFAEAVGVGLQSSVFGSGIWGWLSKSKVTTKVVDIKVYENIDEHILEELILPLVYSIPVVSEAIKECISLAGVVFPSNPTISTTDKETLDTQHDGVSLNKSTESDSERESHVPVQGTLVDE